MLFRDKKWILGHVQQKQADEVLWLQNKARTGLIK